jgi:hypothetical protein
MVNAFADRPGTTRDSLAVIGGTLATLAALIVGAVLAVVFAATVAVIAVMASALLAFAGLAQRARGSFRRRSADDGVIEARHLGGHHWVAYGSNEPR